MKIAYLITAYKDEIQLARLVRALGDKDIDFYIHIDKKADATPFFNQVSIAATEKNVKVVFVKDEERIRVQWGGYSQVEAQLALVRTMLEAGTQYDWCINITGTDYPVWSNKRIREFLQNRNGAPVIKGYQIDKLYGSRNEEVAKERIQMYWFYDLRPVIVRKIVGKLVRYGQKILHIRRKTALEDMPWKFCYGSEYWAMPFQMIEQVYDAYIKDQSLQKLLKTSFIPSEFWVHTVLMSTNILSEREKEDIRFPGNLYDGLGSVALLHYFVYRGGIKVLDMEDYETIKKSEKMFIRKVQTGVSDELIQRIRKERE